MSLGTLDLFDALLRTSQAVASDWMVAADAAAGTTTITVALLDSVDPSGAALIPTIGASDQASFIGARVVWLSGTNQGFTTRITAIASTLNSAGLATTTTLTLADALPAKASGPTYTVATTGAITGPDGDVLAIYRAPITDTVTVENRVVGAGQIVAIASGDEVFWNTVTVNGTLRVNGTLYASTLTVDLGGTVLVGDTGQLTTGAY